MDGYRGDPPDPSAAHIGYHGAQCPRDAPTFPIGLQPRGVHGRGTTGFTEEAERQFAVEPGSAQPRGDPGGYRTHRHRDTRSALHFITARVRLAAYNSSICPAYFSMILERRSFMVGVSSSDPGCQGPGSTVNRLTCSTLANR